ncbi:MAG: hypothetical protein E6590_11720 [Clostridiales bacterium]|uniref:Uncharacterized protein n=1 Tax=Zhenhengia yiwuensis TaxID=2763666 RepID=A0A926EMP4_9FIRM|nr:hypothetical protein [Zhenhengia yiwuensis]MBC8581127.1 hypothetical protein [Zhenhengia yiwuensis]MDU6360618.1 hypothetical protein [Clostridiales bacterium]
MVKLTNPLNRDGILYEKGALLTLSLKDERELIANGLAESYPSLKTDEKSDDEENKEELYKEGCQVDGPKEVEAVQPDKEDPEPKEVKKTSTRIGRTAKK